MIFGPTYEQAEKIKKKKIIARMNKGSGTWFAWFPVPLEDGRVAWLERLHRKYIYLEKANRFYYIYTEL